MAKKKIPAGGSPGAVYNLRLGPARAAALDRYIAGLAVPPKKASVILAALDRFLAAEAAKAGRT